ncbi:MAG: helix-turn-helix domain-containing protein [Thermaerobacter sp.]|nr:helix-turn-helix domain-containing protein [Thermaerobacter sp.]
MPRTSKRRSRRPAEGLIPADAEFLTVPQVARMLQIPRTRAYMLAQAGEIPSIRLGKSVRVPRRLLREWTEAKARERTGNAE